MTVARTLQGSWLLAWRLPLFYVLADDRDRRSAARRIKVGLRPEQHICCYTHSSKKRYEDVSQ